MNRRRREAAEPAAVCFRRGAESGANPPRVLLGRPHASFPSEKERSWATERQLGTHIRADYATAQGGMSHNLSYEREAVSAGTDERKARRGGGNTLAPGLTRQR